MLITTTPLRASAGPMGGACAAPITLPPPFFHGVLHRATCRSAHLPAFLNPSLPLVPPQSLRSRAHSGKRESHGSSDGMFPQTLDSSVCPPHLNQRGARTLACRVHTHANAVDMVLPY